MTAITVQEPNQLAGRFLTARPDKDGLRFDKALHAVEIVCDPTVLGLAGPVIWADRRGEASTIAG